MTQSPHLAHRAHAASAPRLLVPSPPDVCAVQRTLPGGSAQRQSQDLWRGRTLARLRHAVLLRYSALMVLHVLRRRGSPRTAPRAPYSVVLRARWHLPTPDAVSSANPASESTRRICGTQLAMYSLIVKQCHRSLGFTGTACPPKKDTTPCASWLPSLAHVPFP